MSAKKDISLVFLFMFLFLRCYCQDASFSQFYNVAHWYNPARVGAMQQQVKAGVHYRRQWASVGDGFRTNGFNAEIKSQKAPFSAGILVVDDKAGKAQLKTFQAQLSLAYAIKINYKSFLAAGLRLGFFQRSIDLAGLKWDNQYNGYQYDPSLDNRELVFASTTGSVLDVGAGAFYRKDGKYKWGAGYAFHHTGQQITYLQNGNDHLRIRQVFMGFIETDYQRFTGRLDALVQRQGGAMEIFGFARGEYRFGSESRYTKENNSSAVFLGCGFRAASAIVPMIGFEWERRLEIGFSYDIMLFGITQATTFSGGPEVALIYRYTTDKRIKIH